MIKRRNRDCGTAKPRRGRLFRVRPPVVCRNPLTHPMGERFRGPLVGIVLATSATAEEVQVKPARRGIAVRADGHPRRPLGQAASNDHSTFAARGHGGTWA